jgi:type IV pilus assembly protein PilO
MIQPLKVRYIVFILLFFAILFIGFSLLINQKILQIQEEENQELFLRSDLKAKKNQIAIGQLYMKQLPALKKKAEFWHSALCRGDEYPSVLEEISKLGIKSGINFDLLAPQPQLIQKYYKEWPISIEIKGSFSQITEFLNQISIMSHLINLEEFNMYQTSSELIGLTGLLKIYIANTNQDSNIKWKNSKVIPLKEDENLFQSQLNNQDNISFVGTIKQGEKIWGLVLRDKKNLSWVQVGDYLNFSSEKIAEISDDFLKIKKADKEFFIYAQNH